VHISVPFTFVTQVDVIFGVFQHGGPKISCSLDLFGESFCTKMLSAYAIVYFGKEFLGLIWSRTLDKWCDETPFAEGSFH